MVFWDPFVQVALVTAADAVVAVALAIAADAAVVTLHTPDMFLLCSFSANIVVFWSGQICVLPPLIFSSSLPGGFGDRGGRGGRGGFERKDGVKEFSGTKMSFDD